MRLAHAMVVVFGTVGFASLLGCSPAPSAPLVETVVVTQVVTQVVEVEVTREVVVTATPVPATPTPAATRTPAPPTPLPVGGKWKITTETSSFDDSKTIFFELRAERDIAGPFETYRPWLYVRCLEGEREVFVDVGMQPDVEAGNFDGATVRIRLDEQDAQTLNTLKSTDNTALFFENPDALIERLAGASTFLFGFTPFNASPVQTTFDVRGLSDLLPQLYEACPQ